MKLVSHLLNTLPKRLAAGALVALSVLLPVANSAADAVLLSGTMGVANVTAGSAAFGTSAVASENQELKFNVSYKNQETPETGKVASNVRVKVSLPEVKGASQTQTATVVGDNTNTVSGSTTVTLGNAAAYLKYVPGSAVLRYIENGAVRDLALSDEIVGSGVVVNAQTGPSSEGSITLRAKVVVDAPAALGPVQVVTPAAKPATTVVEADAAPATDAAVAASQASATDAAAVDLAPAASQELARAAAAGCDKVNVIYCGLSGSGAAGYIASVKEHYRTGRDSYGHTDIRQVMNWGGYGNVVGNMSTANTKLGTLHRDGRVVVDGRVVANDAWMTARFGAGRAGFVQVTNQVWARKTTTEAARATYPVLVTFNAEGKAVAGIVTDCGNVLRFNPTQPPKPVLTCTNLRRDIVDGTRRVKFMATANAQNTTIQNYRFVFGDGTQETVKTNKESAETTHTYPDWSKEYTAKVFVDSNDIKDRSSSECAVTFKTPRKPNPSVKIEKTVSKNVLKVDEHFTYTVKVTNDGNRTLTDLKVTDPAPEGVKFLSADKGDVNAAGSRWAFTINKLEVDESRTFKITAKVTKAMPGQIVNKACVDTTDITGSPDDCDDVPIVVGQDKPSVAIEKTVSKSQLKVGEEFTYTIKVTNNGNVVLNPAFVGDNAPENVVFLAVNDAGVDGGISADGKQFAYSIHNFGVGQTRTFNITAKVTKYVAGQIVNTACVDTNEIPTSPDACDDVPVVVEEDKPSVAIEKTVSKSQLKVGEEFTYTIKVTNNGNVVLNPAFVGDNAPENVVFLAVNDAGVDGGISADGKQFAYSIHNFGVGQTRTFNITAKVTKYVAGQIVNTACVDTNEIPTSPDACDDVPVVVTEEKPSILVQKTSSKEKLSVNEEFTYTIKVTNNGNKPLTDVKVNDSAPEGVTFLSASTGTVNNEGTAWTTTIPALAVGESKDFTLKAKVTKYMPDQIVNKVCVDTPDITGNPDDCDDVPVVVTQEKPSILVAKTTSKSRLKVGEEFTYTIKVTNNGNKPLTDVKVNDSAPEGVTFLSASTGTVNNEGTAWTTTIPALAVGESKDFTLKAKVTKYMPDQIVNKVCVDTPDITGNPDDCDDVPVTIIKVTQPIFSCDMLTLTAGTNRTLTANVRYVAAGGAKLKSVAFDFGDGNTVTTDQTSRQYQYAQDGTYTVTARLLFSVDGTDKYAEENENCKAQVKFTSPEVLGEVVTPTSTPTSGMLPNTGAAGVALLTSAVAMVAAIGHQLVVGRKRAF